MTNPKLRFKADDGIAFPDWEEKTFDNVFVSKSNNTLSRDSLNYEEGQVRNIHYGDILVKFGDVLDIQKQKSEIPYINQDCPLNRVKPDDYLRNGDVIFADTAEDETAGKAVEIAGITNEKVLSGLHTIPCRTKFNFSSGYLGYYLNSTQYHRQIIPLLQGAKVSSINKQNIAGTTVRYPSLPEQQKIAGFLSSIDEKITLTDRKLELMKQYKQGVMQQIFSQEIRFKDDNGNDYPDWVDKKLGDVGEIVTGKTPSTSDESLWEGEIPFVTPTDITEQKYQHQTLRTVTKTAKLKLLPEKTVMFVCIASIGKMSLSVKPCITNQQINSVIPRTMYDNEYVYYALLHRTPFIKSTQANTTLPIINKTEFSKFAIPVPSLPEQQKIAGFLSSIDEKIALVGKQLSLLKEYKKSLMQKMFV